MSNAPFTLLDPASERGQATVDRLLTIARRNLRLLLVCLLVVPAVALIYSLAQDKEYTASASLLFRDPGLDDALLGDAVFDQDDDPERTAATNLRLVSLRQISGRTAEALPGSGLTADEIADKVTVSPQGESDLIAVEAVDGSPQVAARLANTFANEYIEFRRDADRAKIAEAEALVNEQLQRLGPEGAATADGAQLEQRARELEIMASLQTGNAELVQPAEPPSSASSPKPARNLALGLLLGIFLGGSLTFLREQLDRRLKDPAEAADVFGLPVLAVIPESRAISTFGLEEDAPPGPEAEAFRMLRANLRYFNVDRDVKSILVTSAAPQDGKTTVSWNLALAEAQAGKRVLYVEADLRRPTLATQLQIPAREGLSLVLAGMVEVGKATRSVQGVDVLLAGPLPPNPTELLESQRMRELIQWGERSYDRVIIDTPPAAVVADAVPVMSQVNGVLIVVRVQRSQRDAAEHLREQLANIGAPVLGLAVNGVTMRPRNYSYGSPGTDRLFRDQPPGQPRQRQASSSQRPSSAQPARASSKQRAAAPKQPEAGSKQRQPGREQGAKDPQQARSDQQRRPNREERQAEPSRTTRADGDKQPSQAAKDDEQPRKPDPKKRPPAQQSQRPS
ncbi:MAG TPA: polysaccharide biosynthesis tyrosine autokinase [Thermoleophilaceae bacterium]|nr:polysaccharide biosynthesis tyrosine autokinase [Thermoleophilaceae bacterium]